MAMNIASEDKQSILSIDPVRWELMAYPSVCVKVELQSPHLSADAREVWIAVDELEQLAMALTELDVTRTGEAILEGISPGELELRFYPLDARGHIAVDVKISGRHFVGENYMSHECHTAFELDPTTLPDIAYGFKSLVQN